MSEIEFLESGIYAILNVVNDKTYVGSTINFKIRFRDHLSYLKANKHHNKILQRAFNKYGVNNFIFVILEFVNKHDLHNIETIWIQKLKAFDRKYGYNILPIGGSRLGIFHTKEQKLKISNSLKGIIRSKDTKEKISKSKLGHFVSKKTREKISLSSKGRKPHNKDILKWPCKDGWKCQCEKCRQKKKENKRNWDLKNVCK